MQTFIQNLEYLTSFFLDCLRDICDFFLANNLTLLIIAIALFSVVLSLFTFLLDKFKSR